MSGSDKFRSKVECKWMNDLALKMKTNREYKSDFPYSIPKEIQKFTSVHIPDIVCTEKGLHRLKRNTLIDFEWQRSNINLSNESQFLKGLRHARSVEKLAIVGENVFYKTMRRKIDHKYPVPSIYVEYIRTNDKCNNDTVICIRINNSIIKSIYNSNKCETAVKLNTKQKPVNIVKINEDFWDEIILENCGEISLHYKWEKEEYPTTKYDSILKEQQIGCFYFDTRNSVLGPGQTKRLTVLFRPKTVGPHIEMWYFQAEILGKLDPIARIKILLQGCAIPNDDHKTLKVSFFSK